MREPWVWNEIEHWTGADLMETLALISEQEEADSFMEAYAELWDDSDDALESLRYWLQLVGYDQDGDELLEDCKQVAELLGLEMPTREEVISPRQNFGKWSLGVVVAS